MTLMAHPQSLSRTDSVIRKRRDAIIATAVVWLIYLSSAGTTQSFQILCTDTGAQALQTQGLASPCLEVGNAEERRRPDPSEVDVCLKEAIQSPYIKTLSQTLLGSPLAGSCNIARGCKLPFDPYLPRKRRFGMDWPPFGYTMIGEERLKNFHAAILEMDRLGIEGAIVEFGVWRGGAMMLAAAVMKELARSRDLYLFDAFGPVTGESYGHAHDFLAVDVETVIQNFRDFDLYDSEHVHLVEGVFSESIMPWYDRKDAIAVLRVDGNFYDSHQDVFYALYENVPVGGIIILDDVMKHKVVKRFWKDFKNDQGIPEELVQIDNHSGWFRKKRDVSIDQSKRHEPQDINMKV